MLSSNRLRLRLQYVKPFPHGISWWPGVSHVSERLGSLQVNAVNLISACVWAYRALAPPVTHYFHICLLSYIFVGRGLQRFTRFAMRRICKPIFHRNGSFPKLFQVYKCNFVFLKHQCQCNVDRDTASTTKRVESTLKFRFMSIQCLFYIFTQNMDILDYDYTYIFRLAYGPWCEWAWSQDRKLWMSYVLHVPREALGCRGDGALHPPEKIFLHFWRRDVFLRQQMSKAPSCGDNSQSSTS